MAVANVDIHANIVVEIRQLSGQLAFNVDNSPTWTNVASNAQLSIFNDASPSSILPVLFTTDITITDEGQFFLCKTNDIQFGDRTLRSDGTRPIITIDGVSKYPGLIQNGTGSDDSCANIYVCNLDVRATIVSTLAVEGGWIGQSYFASGNTSNPSILMNSFIVNCVSSGSIPVSGGGIVGAYAASNPGGVLTVTGCQSTGEMSTSAGGIIGSRAANEGGVINANACFSSGEILGSDAGGIFGDYAGSGTTTNGTTFATYCYSTGVIGLGCGGIYGTGAGNTYAIVCYSTGAINDSAGGIYGTTAGTGSIAARAMNCYSIGGIQGNMAGGIYGASYTSSIAATNCYTSGAKSGIDAGGIFSDNPNVNMPPFSTSNYSEGNAGSSGWNTSNANSALQGIPSGPTVVGPTWTDYAIGLVNEPYELRTMGYSPYNLTNIKTDYYLTDTYSQTILAGASTIPSLMTGIAYAYSILEINGTFPASTPSITINPTDGTISTTTATTPGLYTLVVRNVVNPYNITTFELTVLGLPPPPVPAPTVASGIPECCQPNVCTMNPQETNYDNSVITQKKGGKAVDKNVIDFYAGVANKQRTAHSQPIFKSYHDYMTYLQGKYK